VQAKVEVWVSREARGGYSEDSPERALTQDRNHAREPLHASPEAVPIGCRVEEDQGHHGGPQMRTAR